MPADRYLLLVEDNPDDEALALHALREHGLADRVVVARDGIEALNLLHGSTASPLRHRGPPVALITDLRLPRIDGFELIRRVRAEADTCTLPLVILSGSRNADDMREAYRLGVNSYVVKPVELDRFVSVLGNLGRYWLSLNTAAHEDRRY